MIVIGKPKSLPTDRSFLVRSQGKSIKQEPFVKLLGVTFDENLSWAEQINRVTRSAYATLQTLKRFKRFTPYRVRKTLAESLVLSKLNYCNMVYAQTPKYLKKRLQRVQTCAAGYVLRKHASLAEVTSLGWLLVEQKCELDESVACFKALYNEKWPDYVKMEKVVERRSLRSSDNGTMINPGVIGSFQNQASESFNSLPKNIRNVNIFHEFYYNAKKYLLDKSIALSLI